MAQSNLTRASIRSSPVRARLAGRRLSFLLGLLGLLGLFGLWGGRHARAEPQSAPLAEHVLGASAVAAELPFELIEDVTGRLGPAEVMAPGSGLRWQRELVPRPGAAQDIVLWLRLSLRVQEGAPRSRVLLVHALFPFWDRVELYLPTYSATGALQPVSAPVAVPVPVPKISGRQVLLSQRSLNENRTGFLLTLSEATQPIYLRLSKVEPTTWTYLRQNLRITERSVDVYTKERQQLFFVQGIYLGVALIMVIYNLVIYLSTRETSYLSFSFLLLAFAYYFAHIKGLLFELVGDSAALLPLYNLGIPICVALITTGVSWFSVTYLDLKTSHRRLHWLLVRLSAAVVVLQVCLLFSPFLRTYFHLINYLVIAVPLLIVIGGVSRLLEGYRPAVTFMASSLITLISSVVQNLCYVQVIKSPFLTEYSLQSGSLILTALVSMGLAERMRLMRHQAEEREKSERLLRNVLPPSIAHRLKHGETAIAERYEEVTVLFADIAGFTELSARLLPEVLVQNLNRIFSRFDALTREFGLEKIKTIGDCYMVVAGLPDPRPDHAELMAKMALKMQDIVRGLSPELVFPEGGPPPELRMRIGLHTGPVVAGVIGTEKFAYDLWGDTVNLASRMESHGAPGAVHCSAAVYQKLRDRFTFREREEILVKGKGRMRTYFLLSGPDEQPPQQTG